VTSLTNSTVWTFTSQPGSHGLVALPLQPFAGEDPAQMDVLDLADGMEEGYWVGRVVCLGGCRRFVFCAVIECDTKPPNSLKCPRCKGRAVPDAHWLGGVEISCDCGRRKWFVFIRPGQTRPERVKCGGCGGYATRIADWPLLD
jgi:hypothetical protein